ncbi:MAG: outer membrane protein assembly factor BamA [Nitrospirota bacterium]
MSILLFFVYCIYPSSTSGSNPSETPFTPLESPTHWGGDEYKTFLERVEFKAPPFLTGFTNEKITSIEVEGHASLPSDVIKSLMGIRIGENLDKKKISEGIKRLFHKGIFRDISVDVTRQADGLRLKYVITEKTMVDDISFTGNSNIRSSKLREVMAIREGEEFSEARLHDSMKEIVRFYERKGYKGTKVSFQSKKTKKPYRINIIVNITEGAEIRIADIGFGVDESRIISLMSLARGDIMNMDILLEDIKSIKSFYISEGYINPVVGPPEIIYKDIMAYIKIPVALGVKVDFEFSGNTSFSSKKLSDELKGVYTDRSDEIENLIEDSIRSITKFYRDKGYYFVNVSADQKSEAESRIKILFNINEGKRVYIKGITFEGNRAISSDRLKELIESKKKGIFSGGILSDNTMEDDLRKIIELYNALGYLKAEITEKDIRFNPDKTEAYIKIKIKEGVRTKVSSLKVIGNRLFSDKELLNHISTKEGMPYNEFNLLEDKYSILALYSKKGYIYTDVVLERQFAEDYSSVNITIIIEEERPVRIGKVIVRGNYDTTEDVIRREILVNEGDLYDYEKIYKTQQNLYRLGIFSDVKFEPLDPDSKKHVEDMILSVKEKKAGAVEFSVGYGDYDRFRGSIEILHKNLLGSNRQVNLKGEMSDIERRYSLGYRQPWFLNKHMDFKGSLLREYKRAINIDTREIRYEFKKIAGTFGLEKPITEKIKGAVFYQYELVETYNIKPGAILAKEDRGTVAISSINPSIFLDTRNDPFNPSKGTFSGITLKYATQFLASEAEFYKLTGISSWFFGLKKGVVFAVSGKGGIGRGLGDSKEIPLVERFFLGGRTTVRGYDQDSLGPKGSDGTPTGGNAYVSVSSELRFTIAGGFGAVVFMDGGNVWQTKDIIGINMKYTTGLGIRYNTPVGPLRLDYGYKLRRETGESRGELHFTLGHAF